MHPPLFCAHNIIYNIDFCQRLKGRRNHMFPHNSDFDTRCTMKTPVETIRTFLAKKKFFAVGYTLLLVLLDYIPFSMIRKNIYKPESDILFLHSFLLLLFTVLCCCYSQFFVVVILAVQTVQRDGQTFSLSHSSGLNSCSDLQNKIGEICLRKRKVRLATFCFYKRSSCSSIYSDIYYA